MKFLDKIAIKIISTFFPRVTTTRKDSIDALSKLQRELNRVKKEIKKS
jgi:hypothetical protein